MHIVANGCSMNSCRTGYYSAADIGFLIVLKPRIFLGLGAIIYAACCAQAPFVKHLISEIYENLG
jgi:hypothetical protein